MEIDTRPRAYLPMFLAAVATILAAYIIGVFIRDRIINDPYPNRQVTIYGEGRATYQPDTATINLGVQVERVGTADAALKQLNDKMSAVINAVKAQSVPAEDVTTQNYSVYPQYDYINGRSVLVGYTANQQLAVKVRSIEDNNTEKVNNVISAASTAGVNQINGVYFDISNYADFQQEARLKAIADAKKKAEETAKNSGLRLGKLISLNDNNSPTPPMPYYYGDAAQGRGGGGASVPSGNQEVVVTIGLTYELK